MVNRTLKDAFCNTLEWCFQIHWKYFRFEIERFKITNVRTRIAKWARIDIFDLKT